MRWEVMRGGNSKDNKKGIVLGWEVLGYLRGGYEFLNYYY